MHSNTQKTTCIREVYSFSIYDAANLHGKWRYARSIAVTSTSLRQHKGNPVLNIKGIQPRPSVTHESHTTSTMTMEIACSSEMLVTTYEGLHRTNVVMLITCIRETPGSNLGWDINPPDWNFSWFASVPPSKCQDSAAIATASIHTHSNSSFIRPYIVHWH